MTFQGEHKVIFLTYHYLNEQDDKRRMWGPSFDDFKKQLDFLIKNFPPVSFGQIADFLKGRADLPKQSSVICFDDGLAEHSRLAAPYLAERKLKALFSIPTCLFEDKMPLAQVVHLTAAKYSIRQFYQFLKQYFPLTGLQFSDYFSPALEKLELYPFYNKVKQILFEQLPLASTEIALQAIFQNVLKKQEPDILEQTHLTKKELIQLAQEGQTIASHSHSHLFFSRSNPSQTEWQREVVGSKKILEEISGQPVDVFAYPYGADKEQFDFANWTRALKKAGFNYALNAYHKFGGEQEFDP